MFSFKKAVSNKQTNKQTDKPEDQTQRQVDDDLTQVVWTGDILEQVASRYVMSAYFLLCVRGREREMCVREREK